MGLRVNIGCGQSPTPGWRNFDNSLSLRLSKVPLVARVLSRIGLIDDSQYRFIGFARDNAIEYADATKGIPLDGGSVEVLYSSHMLEHLDRDDADRFLMEVLRVLKPGGLIRIAVPDLGPKLEEYRNSGDADAFLDSTHLCVSRPRTLRQRVRFLLIGARHHQWMYDARSLCRLLQKHGFIAPEQLPAGSTRIPDPGQLNLAERVSESLYVEAQKPNGAATPRGQ